MKKIKFYDTHFWALLIGLLGFVLITSAFPDSRLGLAIAITLFIVFIYSSIIVCFGMLYHMIRNKKIIYCIMTLFFTYITVTLFYFKYFRPKLQDKSIQYIKNH